MAETHRHLELPRELLTNPRRTRRSNGPARVGNPTEHALRLEHELAATIRSGQLEEPGFDHRLLFRLKVEGLQPEELERFPDFQVVSQEGRNVVVLFASEQALKEFSDRLDLLRRGGSPTAEILLHAIKGIDGLTPEDRTGPALRELGLPEGPNVCVDVELWPVHQQVQILEAFSEWAKSAQVQVVDKLRQPGLILLRVRCDAESVARLLRHRDVRLVDLPPRFKLELQDLEVGAPDVGEIQPPPESAPVVGVIDRSWLATRSSARQEKARRASHIIGDEEVRPRQFEGFHQRRQLMIHDLDSSTKRSLKPRRIGCAHRAPAERVQVCPKVCRRI